MTTEEFQKLLGDYLDGDLSPSDRARIERMIAESPACARLHHDTLALRERLRQLPRLRPSAEFEFALRSRLMTEARRRGRAGGRLRALLRDAPLRSAATLAAAAVVVFAVSALIGRKAPQGVPDAFRLTHSAPGVVAPTSGATSLPAGGTDRGALIELTQQDAYALSGRLYRSSAESTTAAPRPPAAASRPPADPNVRRVHVSF
jgi:anti-sigma factor RsiW